MPPRSADPSPAETPTDRTSPAAARPDHPPGPGTIERDPPRTTHEAQAAAATPSVVRAPVCGFVPCWPASTVCRLAIRCAAWRGSVFTPVGTGHGNRCHTPRPGSPAPMCVDVAGRQPIAGSAGPRPDAAQDPGATTTRRRTSAADSSCQTAPTTSLLCRVVSGTDAISRDWT
jgi:hypothetical protein